MTVIQTPRMGRKLLGVAMVCAGFAASAALAAPASVSAEAKSFRPVRTTSHALIFNVRGVAAGEVVSAHVKLRRRGSRRDVRRALKVKRLRGAVDRQRRFRVRKAKSVATGKLRVKLARGKKPKPPTSPPSDPTNPTNPTDPTDPSAPADPSAPSDPSAPTDPSAPSDPPASGCGLSLAAFSASGCRTLFEDTGDGNAAALWGEIDCQTEARHRVVSSGDPLPMASGAGQPSGQARQLSALDGDDVWGERCELGENWRRSTPMPLYEEGQRRITFISFRLPASFPLAAREWQSVMQMKQIQPAANGGGTPVLSLKANKGQWSLWQSNSSGPSEDSHSLWSAPAAADRWTRFAFDITYSRDPSVGSITVYVDLNGDGDAADAGERSPTFRTYTLKTETTGGRADDGVAPGESIASHLRAGIYHHTAIACPAPSGCASQVDNVQIVAPGA